VFESIGATGVCAFIFTLCITLAVVVGIFDQGDRGTHAREVLRDLLDIFKNRPTP
jgi:hypothetical protein